MHLFIGAVGIGACGAIQAVISADLSTYNTDLEEGHLWGALQSPQSIITSARKGSEVECQNLQLYLQECITLCILNWRPSRQRKRNALHHVDSFYSCHVYFVLQSFSCGSSIVNMFLQF